VGVREGEVSGTGDQWRAAAWAAPLAAASMLNVNLADYTVDYDVDGRVDGPSAGGLMTIATIAAFMGDTLKTDVTMTGTINPTTPSARSAASRRSWKAPRRRA